MLKKKIRELAKEIAPQVVSNRRHLHAHPELSFQEFETAAFVKQQLDELGIAWQAMAGTGVVGIIQGELPGEQTIALRADMDALPITEANNVDYLSQNPGVMHACGHDAHTSSLLGTAAILQSLRSEFGGSIKLIFQPGEEKLPGGATLMIEEGVLINPKPATMMGQHVMPSLEAGKVAFRKGIFLASMDELTMTVTGRGGHGAMPHQNIDPVLITAHIIVALQQVVSRFSNPVMPSVLSFGKLRADGAINVIPDQVFVEGTFRTMNEAWRNDAHQRIKKMAEGIAESMGGSCEFNIVKGYPVLVNDEVLAHQARVLAEEYLGSAQVEEAPILMVAEDFAYYTQELPACFYFLGVGNKQKGIGSALHTATFNLDEDVLELSIGLMAYMAIQQLRNEAGSGAGAR